MDDAPLHAALERLAEADILLVEGLPPEAEYRFKHALIQDAAYENLLKSRRQALHRRAAETLRDAFPDRAAAQPEVLAHHFTEAGLGRAAIDWWGKAGDQALRRSAFQEAIAHLGKAIAMADRAAGGTAADASGERRHLHVAYGNALIAARGYGRAGNDGGFRKSPRVARMAKRTRRNGWRPITGYGPAVTCGASCQSMRTHAAAFLRDVEARPNSPEAGVAHRVAGITRWFAGEYLKAREHFERALALFEPGRDDDLAFRFGHDAGVAAMIYLALAFGRWAKSRVRFPSVAGPRRGSRASDMSARTHIGKFLGLVRTDARRLCARRAERHRTRPISGASTICRCGEPLEFFSRAWEG